jgi:hypothetical protein
MLYLFLIPHQVFIFLLLSSSLTEALAMAECSAPMASMVSPLLPRSITKVVADGGSHFSIHYFFFFSLFMSLHHGLFNVLRESPRLKSQFSLPIFV